MADYIADLRDVKFTLLEVFDVAKLLASGRYEELDLDDLKMVLDEAYKFAKDELAPTNEIGDREGCALKDGQVTVPEAFRKPFALYAENGWLAMTADPEWGGQGMPQCLKAAANELVFGANFALALGMLLTPGTANLIATFGSDELKKTYLEKMNSGTWTGTMCLTEPQAGSDVGACTTRAVKAADGDHYLISGDKIFITFGDHNLTENIIHAVLARTEGAPKGSKGLSLFVVPKFRVNADGSPGVANDVLCTSIEHKLGIHASPTCQLSFGTNEACHGWLLGAEGSGMRAMFQMMNEARLSVALQGSSMGNAAFHAAWAYARERKQGAHFSQMKDAEAPRAPIVDHPDVRMMLSRQRAYGEGLRAMLYFAAYCDDRAHIAEDDEERAHYQGLLDILTPVCKAYGSDMGFRMTEWAVQTYGGYGYLKDYPAEQYLRDAKIASIYEGTNGIQALDLVGRKLGARGGADAKALYGMIAGLCKELAEHPALGSVAKAVSRGLDGWAGVNRYFVEASGKKDFLAPLLGATEYLSLTGDLVSAYFLLLKAAKAWPALEALATTAKVDMGDRKALRRFAAGNSDARFYFEKVQLAHFFASHELPALHAKAQAVCSGDRSAMELFWESVD